MQIAKIGNWSGQVSSQTQILIFDSHMKHMHVMEASLRHSLAEQYRN